MKLSLVLLFVPFTSLAQPAKHIKKETVWVVNKNGKKVKVESETDFNTRGDKIKISGDFCEIFKYEYKDNHKVKRGRGLCKGGREDVTIYTYDKLGRLIQEVNYEGGKKITDRTVNHYVGSNIHMDFSESFNGNEKTSYEKTNYEYYPNGLLKKEIQTAGGSWFLTNEYKYDNNKT